jgi:xyloglucan galactosyltransferase MUR3
MYIIFGIIVNFFSEAFAWKFYIYEFPREIESWPQAYTFKRLSLLPSFRENHGIGKLMDDRRGLFHTHQYTLYEVFLGRLRESKYITQNPEEADMFFIPYDIGMDASTRTEDGALVRTNCPRVPQVVKLLQNSPYFGKKGGLDHFMLTSINQPLSYYLSHDCEPFFHVCLNCTKLCIDAYPSGMFREVDRLASHNINWISIPFPSNFHWASTLNMHDLPWLTNSHSNNRIYSLSFMGTEKITATKAKKLRRAIVKECRRRNLNSDNDRDKIFDCLWVGLRSHDSNVDLSEDGTTRTLTHVYEKSKLCLMPGGDFPTRKGVLDALFRGCVPVTFQRVTAIEQWPWHWGSVRKAEEIVINMLMSEMTSDPKSAFDRLISLANDNEKIEKMRKAFQQVAFRLQYNQLGHSQQQGTQQDAVDVVLEHFRNRNTG